MKIGVNTYVKKHPDAVNLTIKHHNRNLRAVLVHDVWVNFEVLWHAFAYKVIYENIAAEFYSSKNISVTDEKIKNKWA